MHGIAGPGCQTGTIILIIINITRGTNSLIFKTTKLFIKQILEEITFKNDTYCIQNTTGIHLLQNYPTTSSHIKFTLFPIIWHSYIGVDLSSRNQIIILTLATY